MYPPNKTETGPPIPGLIGSGPAMEAIDRLARLEGLLLDPCYTGKAMAGVIDLARNRFKPGQNIVFIHTGGSPGIFTYSEQLSAVGAGAQAPVN